MKYKPEKTSFNKISKTSNVILIEGKDQKMEAINNNDIKLIGVTYKKVTPSGPSNNKNKRKPPKYFADFKDQMLDFVEKQEKFNEIVLDFIKEQRKFNKNQEKFNQFVMKQFEKHGWVKK